MSVLLVTGGSRGIGAEICRVAATRGWAVAVNYVSSRDAADAVVEHITKAGGNAFAVQADVSSPDDVKTMFTAIDEQLGPVTALINNAGILGSTGRVDELEVALTSRIFEVNIMGPFLCASAAIRRMAKRHGGNGGVILNISSAAAKHGGPGSYVDYAATKGAMDSFTIGLAREQAAQGVRANSLRPGATLTEMNLDWMKVDQGWLDWVMAQVPLKRPAEVREIANAALWLISDEASYVTGAILDASGGWVSP